MKPAKNTQAIVAPYSFNPLVIGSMNEARKAILDDLELFRFNPLVIGSMNEALFVKAFGQDYPAGFNPLVIGSMNEAIVAGI